MKMLAFLILMVMVLPLSAQKNSSLLLETVFKDSIINSYLCSINTSPNTYSLINDAEYRIVVEDDSIFLAHGNGFLSPSIGRLGKIKVTKSKAVVKVYLDESKSSYLRVGLGINSLGSESIFLVNRLLSIALI
jgi:hypothetical protein